MSMKRTLLTLTVLSLLSGLGLTALAAPATQPATRPYPTDKCIVSDDTLGGAMGPTITIKHEGREVRLCCDDCIKDFKKDPAKYMKKLDEAEKSKPATQPSKDAGHGAHKH